MATSAGKEFEHQFQKSCGSVKPKVFFFRIKDQPIPPDLRSRIKLAKNPYDSIMFDSGYLFTLELKSTKQKSISFDESKVKKHQIDNLVESAKYPNIISGFLMNFREPDNQTYFIHITDYVTYRNIAENGLEHTYKTKVNKSSISIGICEEIGIKINNYKMKTNYHYHVKQFIEEAIKKYGGCNV